MDEKIYDDLQKLYDNKKIGALVQEICEFYATNDSYEDNSYEDELEPGDVTEASYILFCLQSREQILDEFAIIRKKYPSLYKSVSALNDTLLVNMDYERLEKECADTISAHYSAVSSDEIISKAEDLSRSSENLSKALDKFYDFLHSRNS